MIAAAFLLLLAAQDKVQLIDRLDKQKEAYDKAARSCEEAIKLLETDPETALQKLNEVVDRLDPPDKPGLREVEKVIRIEFRAGDPDRPLAFFPFQYRGRVRMKLAAAAKGLEEKRKHLADAVADLQRSADRGAESSVPLLQTAKAELAKLPLPPPPAPTAEELAAAWSRDWTALRPRLAFSTFQPGEAGLAGSAASLLKRMTSDALPRDQVETAGWLASEAEAAKGRVKSLSRDEARRAAAWCETLAAALQGIDALRAPREALAAVRVDAARIAEYRGSFTMKIGPAPYAEEVRVLREGKELVLPGRSTPLVLGPIEIGDVTVELSHPESGKRQVIIPASALLEGKTYILSGRMKGDLVVTPLP